MRTEGKTRYYAKIKAARADRAVKNFRMARMFKGDIRTELARANERERAACLDESAKGDVSGSESGFKDVKSTFQMLLEYFS